MGMRNGQKAGNWYGHGARIGFEVKQGWAMNLILTMTYTIRRKETIK